MAIRHHIRSFFVLACSTIIHPYTGLPVQILAINRSSLNPATAKVSFLVKHWHGYVGSFVVSGHTIIQVLPQ
jgi:hypothetical protein